MPWYPVAQQRRVSFIVDISAADPITANVAKSVKEGQQKVQYVYRNFPTGAMFGQRAVQFMGEIFKDAGLAPKRDRPPLRQRPVRPGAGAIVPGGAQGGEPGLGHRRGHPLARAARPTCRRRSRGSRRRSPTSSRRSRGRPARFSCCQRSRSSAWRLWGSSVRAARGSTRRGRSPSSREQIEFVMDNVPWPNFKNPRTRQVADEYAKRSVDAANPRGKTFDTNSVLLVRRHDADRRRARAGRPRRPPAGAVGSGRRRGVHPEEPVHGRARRVMTGPVVFNEIGDNANASSATDPDPGAEARGGLAEGRAPSRSSCCPGRSGDPAQPDPLSGRVRSAPRRPPDGLHADRPGPRQRGPVRRRLQPDGGGPHPDLRRDAHRQLRPRGHDGLGHVSRMAPGHAPGPRSHASASRCCRGAVRAGSRRPAGASWTGSATLRTRCRSSCSSAWAWCSRTWRWWRSGRSPSGRPRRCSRVTLWLGPVFVDMARLVAFTVAVALDRRLVALSPPHGSRAHDAGDRRQPVRRPGRGHRRPPRVRHGLRHRRGLRRRAPGRWSRRSSRSRRRQGCRPSVTRSTS